MSGNRPAGPPTISQQKITVVIASLRNHGPTVPPSVWSDGRVLFMTRQVPDILDDSGRNRKLVVDVFAVAYHR